MYHQNQSSSAMLSNEEGLKFLENGDYENATQAFRQGLEISQRFLINDSNNNNDNNNKNKEHLRSCVNIDQCILYSRQQAKIIITQNNNNNNNDNHEEQELFFVYRHGIAVPNKNMPNTYKSNVLYSIIIIFNLALAHHLNGLKKDSTQLLQKANQLYELAHTLQKQEEQCSAFLTVAIVNNMALIYQALGNNKTANNFLTHLLSTLLYIVDSGAEDCIGLEDFFQNVSNLIFSDKPAAAGAA